MELYILLAMLAVFALTVFRFKLPPGLALMLAAVAGALLAGEGIPIRHLVEGGFGFLEAIIIIATAMIFMKVMDATGVLANINRVIVTAFYRWPSILMLVIILFVMFPGMLTGLSSTCILTTGALVAPVLLAIGIPRLAVGSLIAMAAILGEVAPPISIPVMIIGGGVDMPYIGFARPLLLASMPGAVILAVYYRMRYVRAVDLQAVLREIGAPSSDKNKLLLYLPLAFVLLYLIGEIILPDILPHLGVPLIFMIGALGGMVVRPDIKFMQVSRDGLRLALPVMAILVGVGMFLQILTLTGVRGFLAVKALYLPDSLKYMAALLMPFMGSAYASASVIGVPLVYVFLGHNELIITAVLVLMASLGDLMPPPSLLCAYAAQIVKVDNHFKVLRTSIIPIAILMSLGLLILIFSSFFSALIF